MCSLMICMDEESAAVGNCAELFEKQWLTLIVYLEDVRIELSNNRTKRSNLL